MSTVAVVILAIVVLLALLAAGGALAQRRKLARNRAVFESQLQQVNEDLAAARAEDRGWERDSLEAAARDAYARERPGGMTPELTLVQIVDRPGTDEDKAIFQVGDPDRAETLTLGRQDGAWVSEGIG